MKTRNGFVSNSSSSSFVLLVPPKGNVCPHCHRGDPSFVDMFPKSEDSYSSTKVRSVGEKDILEEFASWGGSYEEKIKEKLGRELEAHPGWIPVYCSVDYNDESLARIICDKIKNGEIIEIYDMN